MTQPPAHPWSPHPGGDGHAATGYPGGDGHGAASYANSGHGAAGYPGGDGHGIANFPSGGGQHGTVYTGDRQPGAVYSSGSGQPGAVYTSGGGQPGATRYGGHQPGAASPGGYPHSGESPHSPERYSSPFGGYEAPRDPGVRDGSPHSPAPADPGRANPSGWGATGRGGGQGWGEPASPPTPPGWDDPVGGASQPQWGGPPGWGDTPGHSGPSHTTPSHRIPGHSTPGHATPGHAGQPGPAASGGMAPDTPTQVIPAAVIPPGFADSGSSEPYAEPDRGTGSGKAANGAPKRRRTGMVVGIVAAVLVLALIGTVGFLLWDRAPQTPTAHGATPAPEPVQVVDRWLNAMFVAKDADELLKYTCKREADRDKINGAIESVKKAEQDAEAADLTLTVSWTKPKEESRDDKQAKVTSTLKVVVGEEIQETPADFNLVYESGWKVCDATTM